MNRDDDSYWKFGVFYLNGEDAHLIVPKRYGLGRTLDYARPTAWLWPFGAPITMAAIAYASKH